MGHRSVGRFVSAGAVLLALLVVTGCGYLAARDLTGEEVAAPADFSFLTEKTPCYLELAEGETGLRMNCFHLDGVLAIHSSRWAKLPRFRGESWTITVQRNPVVRVQIDDDVYRVRAQRVDDEGERRQILHNRGYWHPWSAISVFRFLPAPRSEPALESAQRMEV